MKRSESIRQSIGSLIYEQQLYQNAGNDEMIDKIQDKIDNLRSKLLSVEEEERSSKTEEDLY